MSKYVFVDMDKTDIDLEKFKELVDFGNDIFTGQTADKLNQLKELVESFEHTDLTPLLNQLENRGNHVNLC
jgi:hypothetical protein